MIGVIGLGLIGGSLAKAFNQNTDHNVYGYDADTETMQRAKLVNAVEEELTDEILPQCDVLILALYPHTTREVIREKAPLIKKGCIVIDCCGVKGSVCPVCEKAAEENGFVFIGGHPMAGVEHAGFEYAKKTLFSNASMILTPAAGTMIDVVDKAKKLFLSIGFSQVQIATPEEHDKIIAFTSQLAHIVSSAYIKSPSAPKRAGFSAGSYKDLTRVAMLSEDMWTELFLENRDNLAREIDTIIEHLKEYSDAIKADDEVRLCTLLRDGRLRKEEIDDETF
jgi:prephenate dehydrogenase